jgi:hypothetical protein
VNPQYVAFSQSPDSFFPKYSCKALDLYSGKILDATFANMRTLPAKLSTATPAKQIEDVAKVQLWQSIQRQSTRGNL